MLNGVSVWIEFTLATYLFIELSSFLRLRLKHLTLYYTHQICIVNVNGCLISTNAQICIYIYRNSKVVTLEIPCVKMQVLR